MTLAPIYYHLPRPGWARARLRAETVLLSETAPPAVRWRKQSTFSAEILPSCSTGTAERGSYKSLCLNHRARNFGTRFFNARRNLQLRRVRVRRFSARLTQCGNRANSGAILRITLPSQACGCLRKSPLHRVHFYHYYYSSSGVQVGVSQWLPAPHAIFMSATAADGLAIAGTIFAIGLFASQIPMMRQIVKEGTLPCSTASHGTRTHQMPRRLAFPARAASADGFSTLPTYLLLGTVGSWLGYAICVLHRVDLIILNTIGIAFQCAYLVVFARYSSKVGRQRIAFALCGIVIPITALHVILFAIFPRETAAWNSYFSATSAALVTISMFVSPAQALHGAILSLDDSRVPRLMSVASLLYSVIWTAFGALIGDYFIVTPNGCGVALSLAQLSALLYIKCRKRSLREDSIPTVTSLRISGVDGSDVSSPSEQASAAVDSFPPDPASGAVLAGVSVHL